MKLIGFCQDCKYWDPKSSNISERRCLSKDMQNAIYIPYPESDYETDYNFGCIFFEQKE